MGRELGALAIAALLVGGCSIVGGGIDCTSYDPSALPFASTGHCSSPRGSFRRA